ncbi:methyltransferase domain-containing protein [Prauserella sp. ASG 168]|uniref:Methyltransferase domain-containing protein n=1 Tax=Prauserella cavernicola TaxID=2800127 RepID=A0A934V773_9PSEU|nr:methyltransferase domain-containing protein [Prauserella cavernicola]
MSQLTSWDGAGGDVWVANADRFDNGVANYQDTFLAAAEFKRTSAVLDVGCGTGRTTRDAARAAPDGMALGVDLSSAMLELARERARLDGLPNASFEQADAQVHDFARQGFDIAISRHGAMFFGDPVAAFANLGRALRPGGRLVLLTWQPLARQEWLRSFFAALGVEESPPADAPSPLALSDPPRVRDLLTSAGFADVDLRGLAEPMYFGADVDDALRFVTSQNAGRLAQLDPDPRARALEALRRTLHGHLDERGVHYDSATWLVTARCP